MANPNPQLHPENLKPFVKGQSGNPGGKTSKQRKLEIANAKRATEIRAKVLKAVARSLSDDDVVLTQAEQAALKAVDPSILKLLLDSENRGLGTPVQSVNVESPAGTMTPRAIELVAKPIPNDDSTD